MIGYGYLSKKSDSHGHFLFRCTILGCTTTLNGYGRSYVVDNQMTIATIRTGYANSYPRLFFNQDFVLINGKRAPIVGRVCMDQMMVDVTDIPNVAFESEVILIGELQMSWQI